MAAVLKKLIALAPYFPELWPLLVAQFELLQKFAAFFNKTVPAPAGELSLTAADADEEAALGELAAAFKASDGAQALVDLSLVRTILNLARQYPEVLLALNAILDWALTRLGKVG